MSFTKRTWAEIDLSALENNYKIICEKSGTEVCCVVKADAYGHSVSLVAPFLQKLGARFFAVSNIDEALELRKIGITGQILILGYTPADMSKALSENDIIQCVYSTEYAKMLSSDAQKNGCNVKIHIKLDSGMGRIGFDCRDENLSGIRAAIEAARMPNFVFEGIFTHFAVADRTPKTEDGFTDAQYKRFYAGVEKMKAAGLIPRYIHCANSAAIFSDPDKHFNMCRAGIVLYGLMPDAAMTETNGIKPVMTLKSVISLVKNIKAGDTVNYGRTFKATKDTTVATVSLGYADGYSRALSNKGYVTVNGKRANVIGRVCMDQLSVDVTGLDVKMGDEVVLFGDDPSVTDLAQMTGTINYELVCAVSKRVPRIPQNN